MTFKEELETLRGEPIEVFDGGPMGIPCIETSDAERLCRHPVVSVHMITYNHEPYIRQAIEGVMMQKTDFEFELVIGEDCSQDRTREICFEYQKRYPDKIRVLWWHENVSELGGNYQRVEARCRGEFIALCEGDDYWIDPLKLQKQVDVMRKCPSVGYCFTGAKVLSEIPHDHPRLRSFAIKKWHGNMFDFDLGTYKPGLVPKDEFWNNRWIYPRTCTVLFRQKFYKRLKQDLDIFSWRLRLGDALLWNAFPFVSDAYYLADITAVYRLNAGGISFSGDCLLPVDHAVVDAYFALKHNEPKAVINKLVLRILDRRFSFVDSRDGAAGLEKLFSLSLVKDAMWNDCGFWKMYAILRRFGICIRPDKLRHGINVIRHPLRCIKLKG